MCLDKLNLIILHWVKFLIRDWVKMIKKKDLLLKSVKNIRDENGKLLKANEDKNQKQLRAIENQGKKIRCN